MKEIVLVEFTSIAEAAKALKQLIADPDLGEAQFDFEADYCDDDYSDE